VAQAVSPAKGQLNKWPQMDADTLIVSIGVYPRSSAAEIGRAHV
jgi:hypothetical protein